MAVNMASRNASSSLAKDRRIQILKEPRIARFAFSFVFVNFFCFMTGRPAPKPCKISVSVNKMSFVQTLSNNNFDCSLNFLEIGLHHVFQ